jgi:hypothetical protein
MYNGTLKSKIVVNASNIIGWRTKRKIVIIESDDWGSIRNNSVEANQNMLKGGLNVASNHYNSFDSLESNKDLEILFSVLSEFKDSSGRPPVFTPICNMGNPDFNAIKSSNFQEYHFQPLEETLKEYPAHDNILSLWKKGIENRLFVPQLHGREHVNVNTYMRLLQSKDNGFRIAFENRSVGASRYNGNLYPNYLGALHPKCKDEIKNMHFYLEEAGSLFNLYCGYKPTVFVAPNAEEPKELETTLRKIGIQYISRAKIRKYPLGDNRFKIELNWLGKRNNLGQIYLVRNAFFEPVANGINNHVIDWGNNCLNEIDIAFKWNKPAIISSHRVNFVGYISAENRNKGISELRKLLKNILKNWPDVEFMTSEELGVVISKS